MTNRDPQNTHPQQIAEERWDDHTPEWREESLDPEARTLVREEDVLDPQATVVRGYGGDHRAIVSYGVDEPGWL